MKIRPLQGEALIYLESPPTESEGGIAFLNDDPEQVRPEEGVFGEVRSVGLWELDGLGRMKPHPVKPGDRVLINSGSGRWLRGGSERLKIVPTNSILAVVEKD